MILSKVNGESMEFHPYEEIMKRLSRAKSPNNGEFLRYDYRFNPFTNMWKSLQELRDEGVCVEDPMLQRVNFVNMAAAGNI